MDFIVEASGIKQRHVYDKAGILDINRMRPKLTRPQKNEYSIQCSAALKAARVALQQANKKLSDIDGIIVACSNHERPYPSIASELQSALGIETSWAYDMNVGCASACFGINAAVAAIRGGMAKTVLVVSPEMYSCHTNFCDRRSHFIFGDACSAVIVEDFDTCNSDYAYAVLGTQMQTKFSNNIRNNFGFLNACYDEDDTGEDKLFNQQGRQVREQVVPLVAKHILKHLNQFELPSSDIKRLWLHQANINMNHHIAGMVRESEICKDFAPLVLGDIANTGAAGVVIAFHKFNQDLRADDLGVMCSFGAGYSVASVILQKLANRC